MASFNYEWWTVEITDQVGTLTWEFKGKSKDSVIKQINKEIEESKYDCRRPEILNVNWDSLKLDRIGYQRLY